MCVHLFLGVLAHQYFTNSQLTDSQITFGTVCLTPIDLAIWRQPQWNLIFPQSPFYECWSDWFLAWERPKMGLYTYHHKLLIGWKGVWRCGTSHIVVQCSYTTEFSGAAALCRTKVDEFRRWPSRSLSILVLFSTALSLKVPYDIMWLYVTLLCHVWSTIVLCWYTGSSLGTPMIQNGS